METTAISPRPLTSAETARIQRAHDAIAQAEEAARQLVRRAVAERDAKIAAAVRAGASQTDIARLLDISRQAVYNAVKRSENG